MSSATVQRLLLALLMILAPGLVLAQGLGEAAARERQKREASGHHKARVITNDDLPKPDESRASAPAPASEAAGSRSEESRSRDPDQRRVADEPAGKPGLDQAQARVDEARSAVTAAEERVKELSDKLNPMSPSFIYGGTGQGDMVAEEARTREELQQAQAQLEAARATLAGATQAYEDLRLRRVASPE